MIFIRTMAQKPDKQTDKQTDTNTNTKSEKVQ